MHVPQRHTTLALLACLAVVSCHATAERSRTLEALGLRQATNRSAPSAQPLAEQRPCRVPVYMNLRVINDGARIHMQWESRYLLQVVLAGIPRTCGCTLQLHDRHGDVSGNGTSVQAIQQLPGLDAPVLVVVIQGGATSDIEEAAAIHQVKDVARQKLVVIHLGDERTDIPQDASWYPHVKAVFRNYHRHSNTSVLSPLQSWMQYIMPTPDTDTTDADTDSTPDPGGTSKLTSMHRNQVLEQAMISKAGRSLRSNWAHRIGEPHQSPPMEHQSEGNTHKSQAHRALRFQPHLWQEGKENQDEAQVSELLPLEDIDSPTPQDDVYQGSNVFWFPLGYGEYFVPSPALQSTFSERPLLWAWAGSEGGKMERQHMLEFFSQPPLSNLGELHVIQVFRSLRMMGAAQYTSMLYTAKLVPLPKGVHPEQYRLWEALAAGAIPIAKVHHATTGLAHVVLLGFKLLWIDEWADAPELLLQILQDQQLQAELGKWQQHNLQLYDYVMSRVSGKVAQSVCG